MKHYISALVENKAGVLARISGLFARRGFNIDSLAVGETNDHAVSRITIVVDGDDYIADQVTRQLAKLVDVLTVKQLDPEFMVQTELVLIKLKTDPARHADIDEFIKSENCEVVDRSESTTTIEFDDMTQKVDELIDKLSNYEIVEIVRTGAIALEKGDGTVYDVEE